MSVFHSRLVVAVQICHGSSGEGSGTGAVNLQTSTPVTSVMSEGSDCSAIQVLKELECLVHPTVNSAVGCLIGEERGAKAVVVMRLGVYFILLRIRHGKEASAPCCCCWR